jgi:hypothetical protein
VACTKATKADPNADCAKKSQEDKQKKWVIRIWGSYLELVPSDLKIKLKAREIPNAATGR